MRPITQQLVHITYRLHGSIPTKTLQAITAEQQNHREALTAFYLNRYPKIDPTHHLSYKRDLLELNLRGFLRLDGAMDKAKKGPFFLSTPAIQELIIEAWKQLAIIEDLTLYAICVMSNHVHVLLRGNREFDLVDGNRLMTRHKRFTARAINKMRGTQGTRVWAEKVYDRDVRPGKFALVLWYILNNPKKAGITDRPLDYAGSWWDPRLEEEYIGPYREVG